MSVQTLSTYVYMSTEQAQAGITSAAPAAVAEQRMTGEEELSFSAAKLEECADFAAEQSCC